MNKLNVLCGSQGEQLNVPLASLKLQEALYAGTGAEARQAKHFLKECIDHGDLDATLVLADYLIQKRKFNQAFLLVTNCLKYHYKDPTLWALLRKIYEANPNSLIKETAAAIKSSKYKSFTQERLVNKLSSSGQFARLIKAEFNLNF